MFNSETMLERHRQRERERMATETLDERAAALCRLSIAALLTLAPQCSPFALYAGTMAKAVDYIL